AVAAFPEFAVELLHHVGGGGQGGEKQEQDERENPRAGGRHGRSLPRPFAGGTGVFGRDSRGAVAQPAAMIRVPVLSCLAAASCFASEAPSRIAFGSCF